MNVYERIGFRRLYDSIGCSLPSGRGELRFEFSLDDELLAEVYMGPKPRFGIWIEGMLVGTSFQAKPP
jgi:hypothetical protein